MSLLEKIPPAQGGVYAPEGTVWPSPQRGICAAFLYDAILRFQRTNRLVADGRVDPGGPTLALLNRMAGMGSSRSTGPGANNDPIPAHLRPAILRLYQALNTILAGAELDRLVPGVRAKLQTAVAQFETAIVARGGPRRPMTRLNTSFAIAVPIALEVLIVLVATAILWNVVVIAVIRDIMKLILMALHKTAVQQLEDLKAKALSLAVTTTCDPQHKAFEKATNNLIDALMSGYASKGVLGPVARAWVKAFIALRGCLGAKGLILLTMLRGAQALVDLLDHILGTKWLS